MIIVLTSSVAGSPGGWVSISVVHGGRHGNNGGQSECGENDGFHGY